MQNILCENNIKWIPYISLVALECLAVSSLAKCAKKNNLDAIHDTVHEMARDEARHGRALKGLLDRYFG